jgi:hypothetical protein
MHGFIGGGAFPRNHSARNSANIELPTIRLSSSPAAGLSEAANPKWHSDANFLSAPRHDGAAVFDRGRGASRSTSTWGGSIAASVSSTVTDGTAQSHKRLCEAAERARRGTTRG